MAATRYELQLAMKQAFDRIIPKAASTLKKDDMAHALKALQVAADYAEKTPKKPYKETVRAIPVKEETVEETTIKVPSVPARKVTQKSTPAEKAAAAAAIGASTVTRQVIRADKKPTAKTRKVTIVEEPPTPTPAPAPAAPAPAPVASAVPVVEDDTDPKAARIVRAHKSAAAPVVEVAPKKIHRCNCLFCDKKGTMV